MGNTDNRVIDRINSDIGINNNNAIIRNKAYTYGEEQALQEQAASPSEHKEEMMAMAKALPKVPKDRIIGLIEDYQAKIQLKMDAMNNGEDLDIDALLQDMHILLMLSFGKDRANDKVMEEFANKTIVTLRDKIKNTHNTWGQLAFSVVGNSLSIIGGASGILSLSTSACALLRADAVACASDLQKFAKYAPAMGQGVNGFGSIVSEKNNAARSVLQMELDVVKNKLSQNNSDSQNAQQQKEQCASAALRVREAKNQTLLAFTR